MHDLPDEDDYITINITKRQSRALLTIFKLADKAGILKSLLLPEEKEAFGDFVMTMMIEIDNQKLNPNQ